MLNDNGGRHGGPLVLDRVSRHFGSLVAVDDLSLDIPSGELLTLLGPSGCGKTTLLRLLTGFEQVSSGEIRLGGKPIHHLAPQQRHFGIVFQNYALFPHKTVRENVAFGLKARKWPSAALRQRVDQMLDLADLHAQANKLPAQLSGGQQQRVALVRALAPEPGVLLLDEPLSALDAKIRVRLRQEIRALQKRVGITMIYVTHDQEEAMEISDRIAIMNHGRIEQVGTPQEIYHAPRTPFVAEFVGQMNFMTCKRIGPDTVDWLATPLRLSSTVETDTVLVAIRPQDIRIAGNGGNGAEPGNENVFAANIAEMSFLGPVVRLTLRRPDHQNADLLMECPPSSLEQHGLTPGKNVFIQLAAKDLRAYAGGGAK